MIAAEGSAAPSRGSSDLTLPTPPASSPAVATQALTAAEAARRLTQFGPNQVVTGGRFRVLRTGLRLLTNPLVLILLAAVSSRALSARHSTRASSRAA